MIAILLTTASTREEMAAEWARWIEAYGKPPAAVLGHTELPFAFPEQGISADTRYEGVPVLTLDDFLNLHGDDLDPDEEDDDDDDEEWDHPDEDL